MAMHIVIDGYNLTALMASPNNTALDLESTRNELIKRLQAYKRLKGHKITVVFDGKKSGSLYRARTNQGGIEIVFSKDGEEADEILKEMAKTERQNMTLITSDRSVAHFAETCGAVTISSQEFDNILSSAQYYTMKGISDEEDEGVFPKTGNPRKPSKKERKRLQRIKKL